MGTTPVRPAVTAAVENRLWAAGCVAADEEAVELAAAAPDEATLERWVRRREDGEPLAWITGTVSFCGRPIRVAPGVYVPRAQTEDLARRAADLLADAQVLATPTGRAARAADLCTGSGAVAAHLASAVPGATVVAVDIDPLAAGCARRNGVRSLVGDLDDPLRSGVFDVVTAVAPYVPSAEMRFLPADVQRFEPVPALDGGDDGLAVVRRLVLGAARLLRPGGWLLTEVGGDQGSALAPDLTAAGFGPAVPWDDEDGDLRGLASRRT